MLGTHAMMGTVDPALDVREQHMNDGLVALRVLARPLNDRDMAKFVQALITSKAIADDRRLGFHIRPDEPPKVLFRRRRHDGCPRRTGDKPGPLDPCALPFVGNTVLDRQHDHRLVRAELTTAIAFHPPAADEAFVDFDESIQPEFGIGGQAVSKLLCHQPRGFVADLQFMREEHRRDATLIPRHQERGEEPFLEWCLGFLENRALGHGMLFTTGGAFVDFRAGGQVVGTIIATLAAMEAIGPTKVCEGFDTGRLVRVFAMKIQGGCHAQIYHSGVLRSS